MTSLELSLILFNKEREGSLNYRNDHYSISYKENVMKQNGWEENVKISNKLWMSNFMKDGLGRSFKICQKLVREKFGGARRGLATKKPLKTTKKATFFGRGGPRLIY